MYINSIIVALIGLTLIGCSGSSDSGDSASSVVGTWVFSSYSCNGTTISISGMTDTLTLTETTASSKLTGSSCEITENYLLSITGGSYASAYQSVSCSPNPCSITATITGPGGSSSVTTNCPSSYPLSSSSDSSYSVSGNQLTLTQIVNPSTTCKRTYLKSN